MRSFMFAVLSIALVSCSGGSAPAAAPPATGSQVTQAGVVADTDRGPIPAQHVQSRAVAPAPGEEPPGLGAEGEEREGVRR